MSTDLELFQDQLDPVMKAKLDAILRKARDIPGTALNDLQAALNCIRQYQRALDTLYANDPVLVEANNLLRKYKMPSGHVTDQPSRVYHGSKDITEHPDSIEGSTGPDLELARGLSAAIASERQREIPVQTGSTLLLEEGEEIIDAEVVE